MSGPPPCVTSARTGLSPRFFLFHVLPPQSSVVALQVQQECMQVECSNKEAQKRPTKSNSTPAMDLGHVNVVLKWYICMLVVDSGIGMIVIFVIITFLLFLL